jgi:hypothetical protein
MYNTNGSFLRCVGFLGYEGGFDASVVRVESDRASTTAEDISAKVVGLGEVWRGLTMNRIDR